MSRQVISYLETDSLIASFQTEFYEKIRYVLAIIMQFLSILSVNLLKTQKTQVLSYEKKT